MCRFKRPVSRAIEFILLALLSELRNLLAMNWQRESREFFAALFGALFAIACYLTLRAWLAGAGDADWLNFAGVIFGVALTIGGTKAIDALREQAREKKQRDDFTLAVRSVAMGLLKCAEAETPDVLFRQALATQSLWRVVAATIDQLPDLDFNHRAKIGIMQDGLHLMVPQLVSHSHLATTSNPDLFQVGKQIAASAGLTILPVTELFEQGDSAS